MRFAYEAQREAYEERQRLADGVLASLIAVPPVALRLLAAALELAGGLIGSFASSFDCWAEAVEAGSEGGLARLKLGHALGCAATDPGLGGLLVQLDGAAAPPWPTIADALAALVDRDRGLNPRKRRIS